jgi:predicted dehydrogenase
MLNGAFIGFGKIAQTSHLPAFCNSEFTNKIKIKFAVEPHPQNFAIVSEKYKDILFYPSYNNLLKNESPDFVVITSPPKFHFESIKKSVENDLHILCEKPFTLTAKEALEAGRLLKNSKKVFKPCHQYKYSPIWKNFKSFIDKEPSDIRSLVRFSVSRSEADPGLDIFNNVWRKSVSESGGGILSDTGIHYIYLSNWMLGGINKITARTDKLYYTDYDVEDTAVAILEGEKGISEISLTWAASGRENSASVYSKKGYLNYKGGNELQSFIDNSENLINVPDASDKSHYSLLYVNLIRDFIKEIEDNISSINNINEAMESIHILEKCYESSHHNRSVIYSSL